MLLQSPISRASEMHYLQIPCKFLALSAKRTNSAIFSAMPQIRRANSMTSLKNTGKVGNSVL